MLTISAESCLLTRAIGILYWKISYSSKAGSYCSFNYHCAFGVHSFYTQEYIETALWGTLFMVSQGTLYGGSFRSTTFPTKELGWFWPLFRGHRYGIYSKLRSISTQGLQGHYEHEIVNKQLL